MRLDILNKKNIMRVKYPQNKKTAFIMNVASENSAMENVMTLMDSVFAQKNYSMVEKDMNRLFQEINETFRQQVLALDRHDICLFLPHCLRSRNCPAASDDEGVKCEKCGQCLINTFISTAEEYGIRVFCVPGGSLLEKLVVKYRPKAIIGVACKKEIMLGLQLLWDKGFLFQVFLLEKDGCFETDINPEPLLSLMTAPINKEKSGPVAYKQTVAGKEEDNCPPV